MPDELPPQSEPLIDPVASTPLTTTPAQPSSTGLSPNVAAGLAALFPLLGGIIFTVVEKQSKFVRFWAMQSIFFGGANIVFQIISRIMVAILGPLAVLWGIVALLVGLVFLAIWIITIIQAFSGKEWEIPILGKLARQQVAKV